MRKGHLSEFLEERSAFTREKEKHSTDGRACAKTSGARQGKERPPLLTQVSALVDPGEGQVVRGYETRQHLVEFTLPVELCP